MAFCQSGRWKVLGEGDLASFSDPGHTILPSGLIIQWGRVALPDQANATQPLSKPFPHGCLTAQATTHLSGNASYAAAAVMSCQATTITVRNTDQDSGTQTIRWLAIGY